MRCIWLHSNLAGYGLVFSGAYQVCSRNYLHGIGEILAGIGAIAKDHYYA